MKSIFTLTLLVAMSTFTYAHNGMIHIDSNNSVEVSANKLVAALESKGMTLFNRIEHSRSAKKVGIEMPDTTLIIFGNPKVGSPLMLCAPHAAIDLPQKMLINKEEDGVVKVTYNDPMYLKKRHQIEGCDDVLAKISKALSNFAKAAAN
jgi:uncharacterized protein (DUF302 family)